LRECRIFLLIAKILRNNWNLIFRPKGINSA
jgi:hypothetical protein